MGYTPTTQGGAAPSTNAMSSSTTGDFPVVTDPRGTQHPFAHEPVSSDRNYRDPKTTPASDMLRNLIGLGQDQLLAMQNQLVAAGYLSKNAVSGVADADTRKAYAELLQDTSSYNSTGQYLTPDDLLSRRISSRTAVLASTGDGPLNYQTDVHTYTPTDPARIRLTAEAAFKEALGRKPKPAELAKFTASFAAQEQHAQQVGFDAQDEARGAYIGRQLANSGISAQGATSITPIAGGKLVTVDAGGAKFTVAAEAAESFTGFINELIANGYQPHSVQGYNDRNIVIGGKDTGVKSEHAKGFAIDIDPAKNPDGSHKNALPGNVAQIAAKYGLKWGGNFKSRSPDPMHFEWKPGGVQAASTVNPQVVPGPAGAPAPVSTAVTVSQPDAGAQAIEFARAQNPNETQAYDIGQQFQNLLSILGKPVV